MLKKFLYILITMCQLIFLAGTYVLSYYTRKKLGMNRWLMYHNMQWEKKLPIFMIKNIIAIVIVLTTSIIIYKYIKNRNSYNKFKTLIFVALVIIAILTIIYLYYFNVKLHKTYYLNSAIFISIYLFQLLKLKL